MAAGGAELSNSSQLSPGFEKHCAFFHKNPKLFFCYFRLKAATNMSAKPARIMERSIFSERYCFLENSLRMGVLSSAEFSLMNRWFQFAKKQFEYYVKPDLIGKITQYHF